MTKNPKMKSTNANELAKKLKVSKSRGLEVEAVGLTAKYACEEPRPKQRNDMEFFELLSPIKWLFLAHALVGTVALASFTIPLFSKKGGKLHIKAGWIYTYAMVLVGLESAL